MKTPNITSKTSAGAKIAGFATALVVTFAVLAFMTLTQAASTDAAARELATEMAGHPGVDVAQMLPALNSAGDHVYAEMYIRDGTGVVTTPNDAGVYTVIAGSPLTAGETDGSGCITASTTTGLFTVALRCGQGELELTACLTDVAGSSNTAGVSTGAWHKNGAIISASPLLRKAEPVDAGNTRDNFGCATIIADGDKDDTFGFYVTNPGGGVTFTTRDAAFRVKKLLSN